MSKSRIVFFVPVYTEFVKKDEALFRRHFHCETYLFSQKPKEILASFFWQFIFLLKNSHKTDAFVSFFAGYSSFLPSIFGKILGIPHIVILGGTDCAALPEIGYGNFRKQPLKWITKTTIELASHLVPVHASLIQFDYTYFPVRYPKQGFKAFCPTANAPVTVVSTAYDGQKFYCAEAKIPKSFITVAQLDPITFLRKGIDLILEVAPRFPECSFTIVGAHPEFLNRKIPDNVKLLPRIPNNELRELLGSQQFYLQLSLMEGLPNALCEAMLCECIPIGSDVAGIPDGIGESGFVLNKRDVNSLELLMKEALGSGSGTLGQLARKRILETYPMEVRNGLVEIIKNEMIKK